MSPDPVIHLSLSFPMGWDGFWAVVVTSVLFGGQAGVTPLACFMPGLYSTSCCHAFQCLPFHHLDFCLNNVSYLYTSVESPDLLCSFVQAPFKSLLGLLQIVDTKTDKVELSLYPLGRRQLLADSCQQSRAADQY